MEIGDRPVMTRLAQRELLMEKTIFVVEAFRAACGFFVSPPKFSLGMPRPNQLTVVLESENENSVFQPSLMTTTREAGFPRPLPVRI
jgi:hypothetical protein